MTSLTDSLRVSFEADNEIFEEVDALVKHLNTHINDLNKKNKENQLIYNVRTFNVIGKHGMCNLLLTWKPVELYNHVYTLLTVVTMLYTIAEDYTETPRRVISIENDKYLDKLNIHLTLEEGYTNADLNNLLSFIKDKYVDNTTITLVDNEVVLNYKVIKLKCLIELVMDIISSCSKEYGYIYFKFSDDNDVGDIT